jgi:HK97 family phage prohead protease
MADDPILYSRSFSLDGIEILRAADGHGDGRTVEAYAAVFDTPTEITDGQGHYLEVIDRTAFNRTITHGIDTVGFYYHHGLTIHATPSDLGSVPIGSPLEIKPDGKGLRTVTRFNRSALADSVLEAIRNGDIRGYSFRGKIFKSSPSRVPKVTRSGGLPTITRMELGLMEYGPTPTPAYRDAGILAIRSELGEVKELLTAMRGTIEPSTPDDQGQDPDETTTPDQGPGSEASRGDAHADALALLRFRSRLRERGM